MATSFGLATRPFGVIDAINRMAAATGSPRYAAAASNADYNGHAVSVYFNAYRGYWLADYVWSGRNVLARGSLEQCVRAAKREYDRGALGASVRAYYPKPSTVPGDHAPAETEEDFERLCRAAGYTDAADDKAHRSSWWTSLHDQVHDALALERHGLAPAVGFLANSKTLAEYEAKLDDHRNERRAARRAGGSR